MANSKMIIVEGAQGTGKTTVTDYIRHSIKYTNLYRLSGTSDSTKEGKKKAQAMYDALMDYIEKMQNESINLVFDRTFFSEENYTRLGFKEYSFSDVYYNLVDRLNKMDYDIGKGETIYKLLSSGFPGERKHFIRQAFETAGENYRPIQEEGKTVIVP